MADKQKKEIGGTEKPSSAAIVMPTRCGLKVGDEVEIETTGAIGNVEALLPDGKVCVDLGLYSQVYHCTILNYPE